MENQFKFQNKPRSNNKVILRGRGISTSIGILIIVIIAILVGGIFGWQWWMAKEEAKVPEVKVSEEVVPEEKAPEKKAPEEKVALEEVTNWPIFSIEEWGFSMKIHPEYIKEAVKEKDGRRHVTYSKDKETLIIVIEKTEIGKMMRSTLLEIVKREPEEYTEATEAAFNAKVISTKNLEKGTCVGKWNHLLREKDKKFIQILELTSFNLEGMYLIINFEYYEKKSELEILKTIETIECTK